MAENYDKLIMSNEEMRAKYQELGKHYSWPYFFRISNGNQSLYFLGTSHTNSKGDPQFQSIRKHWTDFINETNALNSAVFFERKGTSIASSEDEAIKKDGESGFIIFLAAQENVEFYSPEPDRKYEISEVTKKFNKDEVMFYYVSRMITQRDRQGKAGSLKSYIESTIESFRKFTMWNDFDYSFDHFIQVHNHLHNHNFPADSFDCFKKSSDPYENKVSAASSLIRDRHILEEIKRYWDSGKNVFVVYGSGHAIKLETALKQILK